MNKPLFEKYAGLELQARAIEAEQQLIKAQLLDEMQKEDADIVEIDTGSFSLVHRRSWTYSPAVVAMVEQLARAKKEEERKKIAECEEKITLMFKPK